MMATVWPFATGFAICAIVVPMLIDWQRKRALGQHIYGDGPKTHASKQGTPTMGGVAFLVAAAAGLIFSRSADDVRLLVLAGGAGVIGAIDDCIILINRRALGLRARWKLALLVALAVVYLTWMQTGARPLGFDERWFGATVVLAPWLWWFLSLCAIVGAANAVNLTDGLDGLATGTAIAPLFVFSLAALSSVSLAVLGACVAFLWFNRHPAQIFMGDAGSLLLGALLAGDAIASQWLLLLPLFGIVFVAEAFSVIAQVVSFKLTGKRLFKMSPLHHHFELSGWSESRVTSTFVLASIVAVVALTLGQFFVGSSQ